MRARTKMSLAAGLAAPAVALASTCPTPAPQPLQATAVVPVANELAALSPGQLGSPDGVLAQAYEENLSLDLVLLRIRMQACRDLASVTPGASVVDPADPAAYKPRTEFDNTPWRFNMSQNGKNMTADEFSAWMKSRGVRVARGAAPVAPAAPAATEAATTEVPATELPTTEAPTTEAPATEVPATAPSAAEPPAIAPITTMPITTAPPAIEPPATAPAATVPAVEPEAE